MLKNILFIIITLILTTPSLKAEDLNEELDYRVRFSKAADVKILLNNGADPNYVNKTGLTMSFIAVSRKDNDGLPVLKALVDAGADINQSGTSNQYPLIIAVRDGNAVMLKYLLAKPDIRLDVTDSNGMTALQLAEYKADDKIIGLIKAVKDEQDRKTAALRDPNRRNQLMYKWVGLQCDKYYFEHYFKVKLDPKTPEEIRQVMDKYPPQFEELSEDLHRNFNLNTNNFAKYVAAFVNSRLDSQFSQALSNRMRRKQGLGTEAHRTKSCEKVVKEFEKKLPTSPN
jgi:ankyrin repeat protein